MKSNLYKTIWLAVAVSLNFFFTSPLYASVPTMGEETSSSFDNRVSPDFDMDQSGNSIEESEGAKNWEENVGALSPATETSHNLAPEKEKAKPETLKSEEAQASDVKKTETEKAQPSEEEISPKENESDDEEDSLLETDPTEPEL